MNLLRHHPRPADNPERATAVRRGVVGLAAALLAFMAPPWTLDLAPFAEAGGRLLSGRLDGIYEDGWNQTGPLQLLLSRLLMVGGHDGMPALPVIAALNVALVVGAMVWSARRTDGGSAVRREWVVAGLALLWLTVPLAWNGHPPELAIPAAWAYAIFLQRRGRGLAAAVTLGLGCAIAPWAVLGIPCLLAAGGLRRVLPTAVLGGVLGVAAYLPFVLSGHFGMFGHAWAIGPDTLWSVVAPGLETVTWAVRLAQGAVVAAGCAFVAFWLRHDILVYAAAPAAALLLRIATDPVRLQYYWGPVAMATLLAFVLAGTGRVRGRQALTALLSYLGILSACDTWAAKGAAASLLVLGVAMAKRQTPAGDRKERQHRTSDNEERQHRTSDNVERQTSTGDSEARSRWVAPTGEDGAVPEAGPRAEAVA